MITGGRPIIVSGTAPNYKGAGAANATEVTFTAITRGTTGSTARDPQDLYTRIKHLTVKNLGSVNLEISFDQTDWYIIRPTDAEFKEWVSVHRVYVRADNGTCDYCAIGIEA